MVRVSFLWLAVVPLFSVLQQSASADMVAVGTLYGAKRDNGSYDTTPLILHHDGKSWHSAEISLGASKSPGVLVSVKFADAKTAWAIGQSEIGTTLVRTSDGGIRWEDATAGLPPDLQRGFRARSIAVGANGAVWISATDSFGVGPYIWHTSNSGVTWEPVLQAFDKGTGPFLLAPTNDGKGVFVLRGDNNRPRIAEIPSVGAPRDIVDPSQPTRLLAVTSGGRKMWAAGAVFDSAALTTSPRLFSTTDNVVWSASAVPLDALLEPRVLSFAADGLTGVTCGGSGPDVGMTPACMHSTDGGRTWLESTLSEAPHDYVIVAVGMANETTGHAVAMRLGAPGSLFLDTNDGGATWSRITTEFDAMAHVRGVAAP